MSSRVEDLQALARMLNEGRITEAEYEIVKAELIAAPASEWEEQAPAESYEHDGADDPEGGVDEGESLLDRLRAIPMPFRIGAFAGLLLIFVALSAMGGGGNEPVHPAATPISTVPAEPPQDSLRITFDGLRDDWNSLDLPPLVRRGISVTPEAGPLDGFLYRFDAAAVLAGAYDPSDRYVRALMVRAGLFHPDLGNLYVHLCHLLHPGDQDCLETYISETGVYGATAADFADLDHQAAWSYQSNRWSYTLVDDVQTIRVQAPGQ